jgi:hypothetical protein
MLDSAISEKAKGMQGGFLKEKDFKDSHVEPAMEFMTQSFFFPCMMDFRGGIVTVDHGS